MIKKPHAGSTGTVNAHGEPELVAKLAEHTEAVGLAPSGVPDEYRYASLPICVIDAVFSIGVTYTSTKATVARFCERYHWPRLATTRDNRQAGSHGLNDLLDLYLDLQPEEAADRLFGNRQRTSTRSGILKAEAVRLFADALVRCGIDHFDDITDERIELAEAIILGLPGQGSGIAFDYFRMLAGNDDLIKPDWMVLRFVANALGLAAEPTPRQAALLVRLAARKLSVANAAWTPLKLDYAIWQYQSSKPVAQER
ncbi:hypothetical protein L5876_09970 [Hyphobacterium sp. SN044]|uniref:hypothetical protein n=1 Tax=Hyphobacterium sp. SN044 TaxID=2912575 RepID=UPI001F41C9AA|nr:hypothetical protein [Hyphobacterium sp. SN044]MCF8880142.1 hypothetical protein [Hyphobacterium sp. SN044]